MAVQRSGLDKLAVLQFIFKISFSTLGQDYPKPDDSLLPVLDHFMLIGLVYQRKVVLAVSWPCHSRVSYLVASFRSPPVASIPRA